MKVVVIGNADGVLGFSLVGVGGHVVHDKAALDAALDRTLHDKAVGLILITADVAGFSRARVDQLKVNSTSPLVVEVPGATAGESYPSLQEFVQRAVGIKLGGH